MLKRIIELNPNNSIALIYLACMEITNKIGLILLEKAFSSNASPILELTDYRYVYLMGF